MKAAFIRESGGPDKIEYGELPDPKPQEHEVLVRVRACALNHLDLWVRMGSPAYPVKFPHVLGSDVSGELVQDSSILNLKAGAPVFLSPGISCWNCSDCLSGNDNQCVHHRIIGAGAQGGYAQYLPVPARNVFSKPSHLSFEECASFPLTFLTAWHMLVTRAGLKPGETALILGAGSGVGTAAIQIAKVAGARVIAVSSSDEKLALARDLGADFTVNGGNEDFSKVVLDLTQGKGVEVVFEHVGPATWEKSVRSLARRGRIVTCGATTGPSVPLDLRVLFSKDLTVYGSKLGSRAEMEKVLVLMNGRRLKPVVSKVFPLSQAGQAHELLEKKEQFGKVVLKVD